jgi:uncharacterized membrane protein
VSSAVDGAPAGVTDEEDYAAPPVSRMAIAVLALIGVFDAAYLSLYKLGIIGGLTCELGSCEQVQNSPQSALFGIPVSVLGLGAYVALVALALVGVQPRFVRDRRIARAITAIAAVGVLFSAYLTYVEARVIYMWCQYCVISASLITLIFLLSLPALRRDRAAAS